jgi:hypothetical protein
MDSYQMQPPGNRLHGNEKKEMGMNGDRRPEEGRPEEDREGGMAGDAVRVGDGRGEKEKGDWIITPMNQKRLFPSSFGLSQFALPVVLRLVP